MAVVWLNYPSADLENILQSNQQSIINKCLLMIFVSKNHFNSRVREIWVLVLELLSRGGCLLVLSDILTRYVRDKWHFIIRRALRHYNYTVRQ